MSLLPTITLILPVLEHDPLHVEIKLKLVSNSAHYDQQKGNLFFKFN